VQTWLVFFEKERKRRKETGKRIVLSRKEKEERKDKKGRKKRIEKK